MEELISVGQGPKHLSTGVEKVKNIFASRRWSILFLALISFAVYSNTLLNGFSLDDLHLVVENIWITDFRYIPKIFSSHLWAFKEDTSIFSYYRPVQYLIFMVVYYLFGLSPWVYHLVNIVFNTLSVVMVYFLALFLFNGFGGRDARGEIREGGEGEPVSGAYLALASALIFAVHPVHTEAVAWISAMTELSFSLFFLLSLYLYMISSESGGSGKRRYFVISIAAFGVSLLSKETAVTLLPVIIAYDLFKGAFGLRVKRYIPYAVVLVCYFVVRATVMGSLAPESTADNLSSYQLIINVFPLVFTYVKLFFFPVELNIFRSFHPVLSMTEPGFLISLAIILPLFAIFIIKRKDRIVAFGLLWAVLTLSPAFYISALDMSGNVIGERYMYLPSAGFIIFVLYLFSRAIKGLKRKGVIFTAIILLVAGAFTIKTVKRNMVWKDNYTLWKDTETKTRNNAIVYINLGMAADALGKRDEALRAYNRVLEIRPYSFETYYNIGLLYFETGKFDKALESFKTALSYTSNNVYIKRINEGMGDVYLKSNRLRDAVDWYVKAVEAGSELRRDAFLLNKLGIAYATGGRTIEARESFKKALELNPDHRGARENLKKLGSL